MSAILSRQPCINLAFIVNDITNFCSRLLQEPYTLAPARPKTEFLMPLTIKKKISEKIKSPQDGDFIATIKTMLIHFASGKSRIKTVPSPGVLSTVIDLLSDKRIFYIPSLP